MLSRRVSDSNPYRAGRPCGFVEHRPPRIRDVEPAPRDHKRHLFRELPDGVGDKQPVASGHDRPRPAMPSCTPDLCSRVDRRGHDGAGLVAPPAGIPLLTRAALLRPPLHVSRTDRAVDHALPLAPRDRPPATPQQQQGVRLRGTDARDVPQQHVQIVPAGAGVEGDVQRRAYAVARVQYAFPRRIDEQPKVATVPVTESVDPTGKPARGNLGTPHAVSTSQSRPR